MIQPRIIKAGKGPLSDLLLDQDISDLNNLLIYLAGLPYGRNSTRTDLSLVIKEQRGTCSSKHACLATIAQEQGWDRVDLTLCIFLMDQGNTPGIGDVIERSSINYIPEAHCYVRIDGLAIDITNPEADIDTIRNSVLEEQIIKPHQVSEWKVKYHQAYIEKWAKNAAVPLDFDEIWALRERCIANLGS